MTTYAQPRAFASSVAQQGDRDGQQHLTMAKACAREIEAKADMIVQQMALRASERRFVQN